MLDKEESYSDFIARIYPETAGQEIQTLDLTFQITEDCNLQCSYCYQIQKTNKTMPIEVAKKFIDLLLENNANARFYLDTSDITAVILNFIGGEPLLQIELIDQIVEYFIYKTILLNHPWKDHWVIGICSNGTLYFNEKVQQFFKKYKNKISFGISIDGGQELHDSCRKFPNGSGSYHLAIKALKSHQQNFIQLPNSKITLSPDNIKFLSESFKNFLSLGYKYINCNYVYEEGWTDIHGQIAYQQLKDIADYIINNDLNIYFALFNEESFQPMEITNTQNWCGGNGRMIAINPEGQIHPCLRFMETSLGKDQKPVIIGDVSSGLLSTKEQKELVHKLKNINRINQSTQECINCPIAEGCSYCQAYNYQVSGTFSYRATFICPMHKATSLANVYFWNKYYKKNNIDKVFKMNLSKEEALNYISEEEYNMLYELQK